MIFIGFILLVVGGILSYINIQKYLDLRRKGREIHRDEIWDQLVILSGSISLFWGGILIITLCFLTKKCCSFF